MVFPIGQSRFGLAGGGQKWRTGVLTGGNAFGLYNSFAMRFKCVEIGRQSRNLSVSRDYTWIWGFRQTLLRFSRTITTQICPLFACLSLVVWAFDGRHSIRYSFGQTVLRPLAYSIFGGFSCPKQFL
jgi:hypothetical protein